MQLHVIIDSSEIFIGHDAQNKWLYVDWRGEHSQDSSQAVRILMLDSLRMWLCHKMLNDDSSITQNAVELTSWRAWWLEEMYHAGLQYIVWVLPRSLLARQAMEAIVHAIDNLRVGTFDDTASACVWLQQQPVIIRES
ncbi:hypothetical protein [Hymenobacter terrenus]|uniref:hypothetical protein n=1 Tax=Hymenobacter terrenus TaxID=1629124 RepID=UPI0006194C8E|nr:hypothetical protein [Hymenobacter terrenus]